MSSSACARRVSSTPMLARLPGEASAEHYNRLERFSCLVGCRHLQQMADQVAEGAALLVSALLEALVELPVGGEGDPLRTSAQQIQRDSRG